MEFQNKILVCGGRGMVGSAILRKLRSLGYSALLEPTHAELDLLDQAAVYGYFRQHRPEYVFVAAAKVGGILYNRDYQADFLYENLMISANVIHAAAKSGTEKLLMLGSSCIYPRLAPQPIREDSLLTGELEPTNEGYAIAKIAALKLCEKYRQQYGKRFISAMPTNLYGPGDQFHPDRSHVIPGMMRRFHQAKIAGAPEVTVWGTGQVRREFLHVDDAAEAMLVLMEKYEDPAPINVGWGKDCTIAELAEEMRRAVGYQGKITYDRSKPDGTPRKLLDVSRIHALGWKARHSLAEGLSSTYHWALTHGKLA